MRNEKDHGFIRRKAPGEVSNIMWRTFLALSLALMWALVLTPARAADSYTTNLRIVQQVPGSNDSTWGTKANAAFAMLDEAISKVTSVSVTAGDVTLTSANNATDQARSAVLVFTGTPGVSRNVTAPNLQHLYYLYNNSDSTVVFKGGAGTSVTVAVGTKASVYTDGATNAVSLYTGPVGTVVGTTDTQTLTNKTLTLPVIASISNGGTLTLPSGADTLVARTSTDTLTNKTLSAGILTGNTTLPGSGQLSSAGLLGIGMAPVNILDIKLNQNATSSASIFNNDGGGAASSRYIVSNGTSTGTLEQLGTGYTPADIHRANGTLLNASGVGGLTLNASNASGFISFGVSSVEVSRFGNSGGLSTSTGVTASTATGTPVAIFTPAGSASGLFIIWSNVSGSAGSGYAAWAVVFYDANGGNVSRIGGNNGANLTIQTAGGNVTATQNSGLAQVIEASVVRFGG